MEDKKKKDQSLEDAVEGVGEEGATLPEEATPEQPQAQQTGFYMSPEEIAEFTALTDPGEIERAASHRKQCKREGRHPIPPSKWLTCPVCQYRTPQSLVNHFRTHGGLAATAAMLNLLPEQITVVNPELQERFTSIGKDNVPKDRTA